MTTIYYANTYNEAFEEILKMPIKITKINQIPYRIHIIYSKKIYIVYGTLDINTIK